MDAVMNSHRKSLKFGLCKMNWLYIQWIFRRYFRGQPKISYNLKRSNRMFENKEIQCKWYPIVFWVWMTTEKKTCKNIRIKKHNDGTQLAFYVNLHRAVIGPSATMTGRWRPDIDLRRMLTGKMESYYREMACPNNRQRNIFRYM